MDRLLQALKTNPLARYLVRSGLAAPDHISHARWLPGRFAYEYHLIEWSTSRIVLLKLLAISEKGQKSKVAS